MFTHTVFFNNFHNGDVFFSKPYVKHLSELLGCEEYIYSHGNDSKIIKDLNMHYLKINDNDFQRNRIVEDNNILYINTWIGNYINKDRNCNWLSLHSMYEELYDLLQNITNKELKTLDRDYYKPFIVFSEYDIPKDFECEYDNTIIFSNGPALSGQSGLNSTDNIVNFLCNEFSDKKIILTHKTNLNHKNILYTSDIIKTQGSDLNEIAWLSTKCKYIIGRQSGPFSFMQIDENVNDPTKIMISLSTDERVDWLYNIDVLSKYINIIDNDEQVLINDIRSFIQNPDGMIISKEEQC